MSVAYVNFSTREKLSDQQAVPPISPSDQLGTPELANIAPVVPLTPNVSQPRALEYVQRGVNILAGLLDEDVEIAGIVGDAYIMEPYSREPGTYTVGGRGLRDFSGSLASILGVNASSTRAERNDVAQKAQFIYGIYGMRPLLPRIIEASRAGALVFRRAVRDFEGRHPHATFNDASRVIYGRTAAALALLSVAPALRDNREQRTLLNKAVLAGKFPHQNPDVANHFRHYTPLDAAAIMAGVRSN